MRGAFLPILLSGAVVWPAASLLAQDVTSDTTSVVTADEAPETDDAGWSFAALAYAYAVPDDDNFLMPLFYADRGRLHFEARYNYEALETASLWAGYRFTTEGRLTVDFVPMLGAVVGDVNGAAPGFEATLGLDRFELYTEGEYFFDFEDEAGHFFYCWNELYYMPSDHLRFGLVGQRTRVYQTEVEVNRGLLAGASLEKFDVAVYMLNLGWDEPTWILSAAVNF